MEKNISLKSRKNYRKFIDHITSVAMKNHFYCLLMVYISLVLFNSSCSSDNGTTGNKEESRSTKLEAGVNLDNVIKRDLSEIKKSGKLKAITTYSSTSYFIYKGHPMGYEYELLEDLAEHLGVELEMVVVHDLDKVADMLYKGEGDVIAHGLTITKERKNILDFTDYHTLTRQVLVQRKPENWRTMKLHEIEQNVVRNPIGLIGKKIHVRKNSAYHSRLNNLSEEIGEDLKLEFLPGELTTGEIIRKVVNEEIDYTVADQHLAHIYETYFDILDAKTSISFDQRLAWGVRKNSPELLRAVNDWLCEMKKKPDMNVLFNKYFVDQKNFQSRITSDYYSKNGGKICAFDERIKIYAKKLGWDWRLLASLICQESEFNPKRKSWAGAIGLMQTMPATAKQYGVTKLYDPEQSLKAGTAYLSYLKEHWKHIPDSLERIKFILASYNAGEGHVADAQRLAEKYKKDKNKWEDNVAYYLLEKEKPEVIKDEVVKFGYCHGHEPVKYVHDIMKRFGQYKEFFN